MLVAHIHTFPVTTVDVLTIVAFCSCPPVHMVFGHLAPPCLPAPSRQATLVVIEQYLNLKAGEVWHEIEEELRRGGIQPVEVRPISNEGLQRRRRG